MRFALFALGAILAWTISRPDDTEAEVASHGEHIEVLSREAVLQKTKYRIRIDAPAHAYVESRPERIDTDPDDGARSRILEPGCALPPGLHWTPLRKDEER